MPKLQDQLEYMYGLGRFGIRLGLSTMESLLEGLGNPHRAFKSVHITGTTGKGSTAALLAGALRTEGYTTALYTSPHIYAFNERIRVDGQAISDEKLSGLIEEVRAVVAEGKLTPTFFEFTTAVAFLHFARQKVDIAVIEVGMGGALDATNVIQPLVAVITNIGLDHTFLLGKTRRQIAENKAGVIKKRSIVVTGEKDPELLAYFATVAKERGAELHVVGERLTAEVIQADLSGQTFKTKGMHEQEFRLRLLGAHQIENACTALAALQALTKQGVGVSLPAIQKSFAHTRWEGRLDVISQQPLVLVDGAHNDDGVRALYAFIKHLPRRDTLVLGVKRDKNLDLFISLLAPLFQNVITTEGNFQPMPAAEIARQLSKTHSHVQTEKNVGRALALAKQITEKEGTILITGSLYMVADALTVLRECVPSKWPMIP